MSRMKIRANDVSVNELNGGPAEVPVMFQIDGTTYLNDGLTNTQIEAHAKRFKRVQPLAQNILLGVMALTILSVGFALFLVFSEPAGAKVINQPHIQLIVNVMPWVCAITIVLNVLARAKDRKSSLEPAERSKHQAAYWARTGRDVLAMNAIEDIRLADTIRQLRGKIEKYAAVLGVSPTVPELENAVVSLRKYLEAQRRSATKPTAHLDVEAARHHAVQRIEQLDARMIDFWNRQFHKQEETGR